jgi:AraC-like DNA-binding protein
MDETVKIDVGNFEFSFTDKKSSLHAQHFHDCCEVDYYLKADIKCFISDTHMEIHDGDILFIQAFDIHKFIYNDDVAYVRYNIHFKKSFIVDIINTLKLDNIDLLLCKSKSFKLTPTLQQRAEIENLLKLYRKNIDSPALSKLYLITFLDMVNKIKELTMFTQQENHKDKVIKQVIELIDTNYMNPIYLQLLEQKLHLSKFYLSHIFKEVTHSTINQYIQLRRVIEAQKMLINTNKSIIDICYDCGFNNEQHFYRIFRKFSDLTPAKYRISSKL